MQQRRRYYLPDTDQPVLLRSFLFIWLLTTVAAASIVYIGASRSLEGAAYSAHFLSLRDTGQLILPYLLAGNLVAALGVLLLGMLYTHRVAGPIYQIQKRLARLREGDFRVTFQVRKTDRFRSLADSLNETMEAVRLRIARARAAAERLEQLGGPHEDQAAWQGAMRELKQALEELRT